MDDWDKVTVLHKRTSNGPKVVKSAAGINAARRAGAPIETEKKYSGGMNKATDGAFQRLAKIDAETDAIAPATLSLDVGKAIQKGRMDKKLTQKELAQKINEKPNIINDYEMGRAVPNQQVLAKMERIVGVKLRGKNIGLPLGTK